MLDQFSRTELLLGTENIEKIKHAKIARFGIGGVGSFVLEGLVRAGVENFILIDNDESIYFVDFENERKTKEIIVSITY